MGRIVPFLVSLILAVTLAHPTHATVARPLASPIFQNPWQHQTNALWQGATEAYYEGNLEGAVSRLELLAQSEGIDQVAVRKDLAVVYRELGELQKVTDQYRILQRLLPKNPAIAEGYAWSLLAEGDLQAALDVYPRVITLDAQAEWAHYGFGLTLEKLGQHERALASYRRAVEANERFAPAWERLGLLHFADGRFNEALEGLLQTLRTDPSYTHLTLPVARSYDQLGRTLEAWRYYQQASRVFPRDEQVQRSVDEFVSEHRDVLERAERAALDARRRPRHVRLDHPVTKGGVRVRVGLVERARQIELSAGGSFSVEGRSLSPGAWRLELHQGGILLIGEEGDRLELAHSELRLELEDETATWIAQGLDAGSGYFWSREEDLQVRGDLIVIARPTGLTLVNELDIEEYLLAVVPSEMYASMPLESLKAQAIAARTYTLSHLGRFRERGFDVMGSVLSSAYRGVDRENPRTSEAVLATTGEVLTHSGRLAEAYYHASGGGYTASSREVWGGARPYLSAVGEWFDEPNGPLQVRFPLSPSTLETWFREVPAVFSQGTGFGLTSTFRWIMPVSADRISERAGGQIGSIVAIVPGARGEGGRVKSLRVVGTRGETEVVGDLVRSRMGGLKSNAFTIMPIYGPEPLPERFLFVGGGFGHGVGLSQMGAAGMAGQGATVKTILAHYYPGAEITPNYADR